MNLVFTVENVVVDNIDAMTIKVYKDKAKYNLLHTYLVNNSEEGFMDFMNDVKDRFDPDTLTLLDAVTVQ